MEDFIIFRSLGPGTTVVSLAAFAFYLSQLTDKFELQSDPGFEYKALKKQKINWFWMFFLVYGVCWLALIYMSLDKADM